MGDVKDNNNGWGFFESAYNKEDRPSWLNSPPPVPIKGDNDIIYKQTTDREPNRDIINNGTVIINNNCTTNDNSTKNPSLQETGAFVATLVGILASMFKR